MLDIFMTGNDQMGIVAYTEEQRADYYDDVLEFSESTYDQNLRILGYIDLEKPSSINLYASTFEQKDVIKDIIAK